jgi:hypothetical protein
MNSKQQHSNATRDLMTVLLEAKKPAPAAGMLCRPAGLAESSLETVGVKHKA